MKFSGAVHYTTARGAGMSRSFSSESELKKILVSLYKRRIGATARFFGSAERIGGVEREIYGTGKWIWWHETQAAM